MVSSDQPSALRNVRSAGDVEAVGFQERPREERSAREYESLLVQVWIGPEEVAGSCDVPFQPEVESNLYLVDFENIYPAGDAAVGGGAWIVGVVALAGLVALVAGP